MQKVSIGSLAVVVAAVGMIYLGAFASAAIVTITNGDFESDTLADGGISVSAPTGWTLGGTTGGYFNPVSSPTDYGYPAGENNLAFFYNPPADVSLHQNTGYVIASGDIISLSIDFGKRGGDASGDVLNGFAAFGIFDASTGAPISTRSVSTSDLGSNGTLTTITLLYATTAGDVGKEIRIRVSGGNDSTATNDYVDFDNVVLDVVPEPSTALLAGLGGLSLLACRRPFGVRVRRQSR